MMINLPGGLVLHEVRGDEDRRRFAEFNGECNNPREGATCECLVRHHPFTKGEDYWLVEEESSGMVVSSTCLLPWSGRMAGVDLKIAQLEMVLTRPSHRGRGLVRAQMDTFHQAVQDKGYDLSIIWGIPYFYRQFGYAYTIEGDAVEALPAALAPAVMPPGLEGARLRPAQPEDIPLLAALYKEAVRGLDFYLEREPVYWEYLLVHARQRVEVLEDGAGQALGYAFLHGGGEKTRVHEHSLVSAPAAYALLALLRAQGSGAILAGWPRESTLARAARSLGSRTQFESQWLVRISDVTRFLRRLAPLLSARLAGSPFGGMTGRFVLNLYREAVELRLEEGRLAEVKALGFRDYSMGADGGDACLPPEAFTRLATGFRSLDDLRDAWPDISLRPQARLLLETLFPRMEAYLFTPYHYFGFPY